MTALFDQDITPKNTDASAAEITNYEGISSVVLDGMPDTCMIEADIEFSEGTRSFSLAVRQDSLLSDGYYLRFEPFYNRVVADMWPRRITGVNQWYIDGDKPFLIELERPLDYKNLPNNIVHVQLIDAGSILCLYVNNEVALTTRAYASERTHWGFMVSDGSIKVTNIHMYR